MGYLEWSQRPSIRRSTERSGTAEDRSGPVLIAAFEGWSDAGDAATGAVEHLWERWGAMTVASIDPEEFYDFTSTRPQVRRDGSGRRIVDWPANEIGWAEPVGTEGVVLLRGVEPQLRWRTFCDQVLEVADELGCTWILTVGALLADVPHTRPTPVFGTSDDDALRSRLSLGRSDYEGPTGILGALQGQCSLRDLPSASLWAAVPSYAPSAPSPKAAVALATRTVELIGTTVDTSVLDLAAVSYEHQLDELIAEDEGTREYVRLLELQHDGTHGPDGTAGIIPDADELLDEVERFLREQ